ncbi:MAG: insulinase family protein [Desulfobulbaceae bacterium]|nr:insulinase family protein [Desulfobulbaceae bacterium]
MFHLRPEKNFLAKNVFFTLLITIIIGFPLTSYSSNKKNLDNCFATTWPSDLSPLTPDPSLLRGKLKNGFRYVIKENQEPENRVAIYLDVQAGSLHENDKQQGVAHFLEHMLFNGSKNFPPGTLVDYFQSLGMNFGGDTNAHTTHNETVYNIILPNGSEQEVDAGFLVIADYARGALLLDSEIDRERGVILAEKRARDSAGYRTRVARSDFAFSGTRYVERMPIGKQKILEVADHNLLRSYYDAWYRPDNMILVVVGDISPKLAKGLIEKHFAQLSPVGPNPPCPDFGKLTDRGIETFYHFEPELGKTDVTIQTFWDKQLEDDSLKLEKRELLKIMGSMIVGYRLKLIQEESKAPFAHASYYAGNIVNRIGYGSLSAQVDGEHWRETIASLEQILRQAISYGFTKSEVERVKKEILAQLDDRVLTAGSEDSRAIASRIIDHLNNNRVFQSPEQEKELYSPLTNEISVAEVNDAFRHVWNHKSRLISVTGDVSLGKDGTTQIATIYRKSTQQSVVTAVSENTHSFPYIQPLSPAESAPEVKYIKDIAVERLVFPNGLIVNLKKTLYEENRIWVSADFGAGKRQEQIPGMAMLVEGVVNESGTGKIPQSALDSLLAGNSVNMSFRVGNSAFSWKGTTLTKDFEIYSQVLHTLLLDPGLRGNVFTTVKGNFELMYQRIGQEIEGAWPLAVQPFLATNNHRFGLPAWQDVDKLNYTTLVQWANARIKPEDLEISVVGDFDRAEVVSTLTKYFSGMKLSPAEIVPSPPMHFPVGKKLDVNIETSVEKSMVVVAWSTDDFWNIHRTRRLHVLASVLGDRLRKTIREKLAASYSPNVSSFSSRVYHGYGYIIAQMLVKPGAEDVVVEEILKISDQLKSEGITSDELVRARGPLVTSLKESIRTNRYWMNSVLSLSSRYPQQLEWPRTIISDFSLISETEINDLASRYLENDNAAIAKVVPDPGNKG